MTYETSRRAGAFLAALIALALTLLVAPGAHAKIIEIGQTAQPAQPRCPSSPCLAVSRTTGYQVKIGTQRDLFVVPRRGKIVAWTISLGSPSKKQIAFFEDSLGGPAAAGITVLKPGESALEATVTGQSPIESLKPYFGETVQFPLGRALNVRKGYRVALTVPTWAPALAVGFGNDTSWRATRPQGKCLDTETQTAVTEPGTEAEFRCLYRTARLTYTATLITEPRPKKKS
jgi:hypothetical protein